MTNEEIKQAIANASKLVKEPSPELIKALGAVDCMLDEKSKEDEAELKAHAELRENYRKAVLEAPLPPTGKPNEQGLVTPKTISFEEALKQAVIDTAKGK